MKKLLATTAILSILSTSAFASFGNTYNTDNSDNSTNATGGNASAGAAALSGAISGSKSGVKNSGNSESKSGVYGSGNSANLNTQVDASRTSNKQKQDASSSNNIAIGGDNYVEAENVVNTANAPIVIATSDCLGSIQAGGQGQFLGVSFGKTTQSEPCNRREDVKVIFSILASNPSFAVKSSLCSFPIAQDVYKVTGEYNKYCVGAKAIVKTKFWGLNTTKAYEEQDVCAYPTPACRASKR